MKTSKQRIISCVLILLVLFVLFGSLYFILHESHHDCTDETCPVCAMIAICRNTIRSVSSALLLFALLFASLQTLFLHRSADRAEAAGETPVSLKVKLLN